jgi:hypothetical protein
MKNEKSEFCIFLFIWLDEFSQGSRRDWLCTCTVLYLWVNHNIVNERVDQSFHFGLQDSNGLRAQIQHWPWCYTLAGSTDLPPLTTLPPPVFSKRTGSNLWIVRWVPNTLAISNPLRDLKEAVGPKPAKGDLSLILRDQVHVQSPEGPRLRVKLTTPAHSFND